MEKFLEFLSNNYLYFLIAAGVLFFALIGFIVDLKKKNKAESEGQVEETPTTVESAPIVEETVVPEVPNEVLNEAPVESYNPAPPAPSMETPVESINYETPIANEPIADQTVNTSTFAQPLTEQQNEQVVNVEELR